MSEDSKLGIFSRLKSLFSRVSFASDDESDDLGTRAMKRARKQQRKRDEFVTKRELDVLRKVRRERDTHAPVRSKPNIVQPHGAKPIPAGAAKEDTLRKINEIERMMSVDIKASADKAKEAQNRAFLPTQPMSAVVDKPVQIQSPPPSADAPEMSEAQRMANAFARTDMMPHPIQRGPSPVATAPTNLGEVSAYGNSSALPSDNFLNSVMIGATQMMAMDVQELSSDPVLEEAAIHFANAEYGEAERTLQNAIAPNGTGHHSVETWRALFDLYRATGEQSKFESVGLDFVGMFDTSAPNWFSLSGDQAAKPAATASVGAAAYACPAKVDMFVANQMMQFIEMRLMGGGAVALDFSKLKTIQADAIEVVCKALVSLNQAAVKVSVTATEKVSECTELLAVANDKSLPQSAWTLRLEWLRLLGKQDDFETVALDYCVTYEVSPPSWAPSKASYSASKPGGGADTGAAGAMSMGETTTSWSLEPLTVSPPVPSFGVGGGVDSAGNLPNQAQLIGEVTAGSIVVTPELAEAAQFNVVSISCAKLKRIDFASAGTLLNWVLELVGTGKQVQFYDAHRLVAAFFNVIGISGHARVSLRRD